MEYRNPHIADAARRVGETTAHAHQLTDDLSAQQLRWRPHEKKWGVGDCLEHLVTVAELYFNAMQQALDPSPRPVEGDIPRWRPSLGGRILIKGITSTRHLKTPKAFRPGPPRDRVVQAFFQAQDKLLELLQTADGYDLNRIKLASPASRLLRLNLGDVFMILPLHAHRHLNQAERVTTDPDFPPRG
jgi:hypothetical protein